MLRLKRPKRKLQSDLSDLSVIGPRVLLPPDPTCTAPDHRTPAAVLTRHAAGWRPTRTVEDALPPHPLQTRQGSGASSTGAALRLSERDLPRFSDPSIIQAQTSVSQVALAGLCRQRVTPPKSLGRWRDAVEIVRFFNDYLYASVG